MNVRIAIEKLKQRLRHKARLVGLPGVVYPGYRDDPSGFIRDILGMTLTPQQEEVISSLMTRRKVLVSAGHSVGKSTLGACLVLWWHYCRNGLCLTTAPTDRQVKDILWKEVRGLAARAGLPDRWVGPKIPRLEYTPAHFAHGFTARDATRFQGHHSPGGVLILFDEAEGIEPPFWQALKTMLDDHSYFVALYNPTQVGSACHMAEQEADKHGTYARVNLSCMVHPNVLASPRDPQPVPGAITRGQLRAMLVEDSQILDASDAHILGDVELDGVRYRPGPIAEARCLGRRPSEATQGLWGEALWERLVATRHDIKAEWPIALGCDVARYGDDQSVIFVRKGYCLIHAEVHSKQNTKYVAERLRVLCDQYADPHNAKRKIPCLIDEGGVGSGVIDQHDGYLFVPINASSKARKEERYANRRSELWFAGREPALAGVADVSRLPPAILQRLKAELMAARYEVRARDDKIVIMPKDDMKALLGRSPDLADAYNLALYPPK